MRIIAFKRHGNILMEKLFYTQFIENKKGGHTEIKKPAQDHVANKWCLVPRFKPRVKKPQ